MANNPLMQKHARVMTPSAWDTSQEHTHVQDLLDWHFAVRAYNLPLSGTSTGSSHGHLVNVNVHLLMHTSCCLIPLCLLAHPRGC